MREEAGRVLLVDPDKAGAGDLSAALMAGNCSVQICRGVTEAVQHLKESRFDCAIIEVSLPEMPGYEAVPILKALEPSISIIMITAGNSRETEIRARQQDIFYYYIRSFDRTELEAAVEAAIERTRKDRRAGKW